jgi:hypothetical protein
MGGFLPMGGGGFFGGVDPVEIIDDAEGLKLPLN